MGKNQTYNATPPSLSDGDEVETQADSYGNIKQTLATALDKDIDSITSFGDNYSVKYQDAAADNVVVKNSAGYLFGIVLGGLPIADASIEISDHASDGDGNIVFFPQGGDGTDALLEQTLVDKFKGYIPINAIFSTGICVDQIAQTKCSYIYR